MSQDPHQPEQRPDGQSSYPPPGPYPQGGSSYPTGSPYGVAPYPPPGSGYGGPPPQQAKNGLGIAALVLGILSLPLAVFFFPVGLILGILAIIFGVIGMGRAKKGLATNRGVAIGGLVTGIIGTVIALIFVILTIRAVSNCSDRVGTGSDQFSSCITDELGG